MYHKPSDKTHFAYVRNAIVTRCRKLINYCSLFLLKRTSVMEDIYRFQKDVTKYSQFTWFCDQRYYKYYAIYRAVKKYKPSYILECGSGISTALIKKFGGWFNVFTNMGYINF